MEAQSTHDRIQIISEYMMNEIYKHSLVVLYFSYIILRRVIEINITYKYSVRVNRRFFIRLNSFSKYRFQKVALKIDTTVIFQPTLGEMHKLFSFISLSKPTRYMLPKPPKDH